MKTVGMLGALCGAGLALTLLCCGLLLGPARWVMSTLLAAGLGAALAATGAHWYQQSITDGLTGLFNRRHLFRRLHAELERAFRQGQPLSLIIIDVDDFRQYNNRQGHLVGDQVLAMVARTIQSGVRQGDTVGRWGGEEFAVILPGAGLEEGAAVAERIRSLVQSRAVRGRGEELRVTVSAGVAAARSGSLLELVDKADQAMYVAKQYKDQVWASPA